MDSGDLFDIFKRISDAAPIGRCAEIDGILCCAAGILRDADGTLRLAVLHGAPEPSDACKNAEAPASPRTNRDRLLPPAERGGLPFDNVDTVNISGVDHKVTSCASAPCSAGDPQTVSVIAALSANGFVSDRIGAVPLDELYLTTFVFSGKFDSLPDVDPSLPVRFNTRATFARHSVGLPLALTPDAGPYDDICFTESDTGIEHRMSIESVSLFDPYREIRAYLNTPGLDRDAQSDIALIMTDHMMKHANDAPQYEIVYTCDGCQPLIYERAWLDAPAPIMSTSLFGGLFTQYGGAPSEADACPAGAIGGSDGQTILVPGSGEKQTALVRYRAAVEGALELELFSCVSPVAARDFAI